MYGSCAMGVRAQRAFLGGVLHAGMSVIALGLAALPHRIKAIADPLASASALCRRVIQALMNLASAGETLMLSAHEMQPQKQGASAQSRLMPIA